MTGKTKKELQTENNILKKELSELKISHAQLSEKATSNFECNKCDKSSVGKAKVTKPLGDHVNLNLHFKCDLCEHIFSEKWKMEAHMKTCKTSRCELCYKTFKYEDLKKKHTLITHEGFKMYCHFFNNGKTCPYDQDCVFLHEHSTICKYGPVCERLYCMFKHKNVFENENEIS